ncbi:hypothetical protein BKA70DRAFT_1444707 [Coprinopsis sp. MPI-PUGE-AT-0042]|nr:hypothetical protein BKA70DRAFT_1444707 [Coprinopsis sp. MPI-PUGE-AT-0042]
MSEGTTSTPTPSSSELDNLSSEPSDIQVHRTIRRSPRRFSPITPTAGRTASGDGESQGLPRGMPDYAFHTLSKRGFNAEAAMLPIPMMHIEHVDEAMDEADTVESQNEELRRIVERQRRQLLHRAKALDRLHQSLESSKQQLAEMEQELEGKEDELIFLRKNEQQYRNWWLNEIQFTKLLLNKVPDPNRDIELVRASQAHYLGHY